MRFNPDREDILALCFFIPMIILCVLALFGAVLDGAL